LNRVDRISDWLECATHGHSEATELDECVSCFLAVYLTDQDAKARLDRVDHLAGDVLETICLAVNTETLGHFLGLSTPSLLEWAGHGAVPIPLDQHLQKIHNGPVTLDAL
jgi:hypothetical protein